MLKKTRGLWYNFFMEILYFVLLFVYGAIIGSFLCCQVRRKILANKGKKEKAKLGKRSVCLDCGYQLRWYDNIPIFSWIFLGGRCRKCRKKIGVAEILAEVGGGVAFLAVGMIFRESALTGDVLAIFRLLVSLGFVSILEYLAIFDGITGEMPIKALTILNACAIIEVILRERSLFLSSVVAGVVFGGVYYLLYKLSKERFVGGGDWIVALAIGLFVGDLYQAIWVLFLSNFFAAVVGLATKQKKLRLVPYFFVGFLVTVILFVNFF